MNAYLRYKFPSSLDSSLALICHDEKVYEEIIFCKASQYKSQLHFPSQLDCEQSLRMVTRARKSSEASESRGEAGEEALSSFPLGQFALSSPAEFRRD